MRAFLLLLIVGMFFSFIEIRKILANRVFERKITSMLCLIFIFFSMLLSGCVRVSALDEMEYPIVLVAKSDGGSVILKDGKGSYFSLHSESGDAAAISHSIEVGDTLK